MTRNAPVDWTRLIQEMNTDGNIVSYYWNFSDGTNSTDKNPNHIYSRNGTYLVNLIIKDNNITTYIDKLIEKNLMNYEYTPSYNIKFHLNLIKNFIYKAWIKEKGNGTEYFDWLYSNELKLLEIFFKLLFNDEIKDDIRLLKHYLEILGDNIKDEKLLNNTDNIIFDNTKLT